MNRLLLPALALLSAATPLVVDSALKGAALMSAALLGALLLWRASAAARHLVWLVGVLALLAVPLLSLVLPGWRVLPAWAVPPVVAASAVPGKVMSSMPHKPHGSFSAGPAIVQASPSLAAHPEPTSETPAPAALRVAVPSPAAAPVALTPPAPWWRTALPSLWSAGCAALLLRLLGAHWLLRRAARRAQPVTDGPLAAALAAAASQLGVTQRVRLLVEEKRTIPVVWGVWRPRLMLPTEAVTWDEEQLQSVLLHELAHIRRRDTLVQWLTQLACTLHWFNPLVWLAAWRLHVERERACDDMVLASGVKPSAYAGHLLYIASQLSPARWTSACGLAMARKSALEGRLHAVLSEKLNRHSVTRTLMTAAILLSAAVAVPVAMLRAADEEWNPPSGAHVFGNDFSAFCIHDGKDTSFVIAYHGDFDSSSRSSSNAQARTWNNDVTLTAKKPGIALSFLRTHVAPGKLSITTAPAETRDLSKPAPAPRDFGQKQYDLAKGRVFLFTDNGLVRQLNLPTPVVRDQETLKELAALIASMPPQQGENIPLKPNHKDAVALYEIWQRHARLSGNIPGALIGELAAAVKVFIGYNPTWETVPKLKEILPRLDATHDWKPGDAIALLNEVAAVQDSPLQTAAEKLTASTISQGKPLPENFANVAWGETQPNGLRAAWVLEPDAAEHRMGTALKARLLVQNTGKLPVMVRVPTWHQGGVSARNAEGAEVQVSGIQWTTIARLVPVRLGPGHFIEINAPGVGLGPDAGRGPWARPRVGSHVLAKDGTELILTHGSLALDGSGVGMREDAPHLIGPGWWQAHIKARLAREFPLPASGAKRTHLLDRAMRELFASTPTADEIAAFATDQTDGAFDALVQRLAARTDAVEFSGSLPTAPVKFRVLPVDPAADKTPRVVLGPGEYPLSAGTAEYGAVTLKIIGRPVGDRRTNDAQIIFEATEATGKLRPDPHKLEIPDGWGTWAIVCRPGEGTFYLLHKGDVRKIDYSNPGKVTDTPATDLPPEFRDEVKRQLDIAGVSAESQAEVFEKPAPPAESPAPKPRIRGKVLKSDGSAAVGVEVRVDDGIERWKFRGPAFPDLPRPVKTADDGTFSIDVPKGAVAENYEVFASSDDFAPLNARVPTGGDVGMMQFEKGSPVTGRVIGLDGAGLAKVGIWCKRLDWRGRGPAPMKLTSTGADGTFSIPPIATGRHVLQIITRDLGANELAVAFANQVIEAKDDAPLELEIRPLPTVDLVLDARVIRANAEFRDFEVRVSGTLPGTKAGDPAAYWTRQETTKLAEGKHTIAVPAGLQNTSIRAGGVSMRKGDAPVFIWQRGSDAQPATTSILELGLFDKPQTINVTVRDAPQEEMLEKPAPPATTPEPKSAEVPAKTEGNIVKIPDDQYVKSSLPVTGVEGLVWNDPENGLSLGYRIIGDEWRILGKQVTVELWVRNPGDKDVKFQLAMRPDMGLRLKLKNEKSEEINAAIVPNRRPPFGMLHLLPPGHALKVKDFPVSLFRPINDVSSVRDHFFPIDPGDYTFHCELELPGFTATGEGGKQLTPAEGEWTGKLTTRALKVSIVDLDAPAPKSAEVGPRTDVKPVSKMLFNEDYAATAVQSEKDVNFVLFYQGDLSSGISEWSSGAKWRFNGTVYLVDAAKTAVAGKNVNKRAISVQYTSDEPKKLYLDGKAYDLDAGRVFVLGDTGEPSQLARSMALRNMDDLVKIGDFATTEMNRVRPSVKPAVEVPQAEPPKHATLPVPRASGDWSFEWQALSKEVADSQELADWKPDDVIAWGPEQDGLRSGMLIPRSARLGETVKTMLVLRNISDTPKDLKVCTSLNVLTPSVLRDESRAAVEVRKVNLRGVDALYSVTLQAGEQFEFAGPPVLFGIGTGIDGKPLTPDYPTGGVVNGVETLQLKFPLLNTGGPETGEAVIRVDAAKAGADAGTSDPNPAGTKLPDSAYPKSGVPLAEPSWPMPPWGEETDGLSAGIRVTGEARISGEVKAELWVRNSSAKEAKFSHCHRADVGMYVVAKDQDGKDHAADITSFRSYPVFGRLLLPPGHIVKVKEFSVKFRAGKNDKLESGWVNLDLTPGNYKLRTVWSDTTSRGAAEGEWTGKLTTGEVDFKLTAANAEADTGKPNIAAPAAPAPAPKSAEAGPRSNDAALQPKHEYAQSLFRKWQANARTDGKIPGALMGQLARTTDDAVKQTNDVDVSAKLAALRPRLDASRDWTQADVVAMLDDLTAIATAPVSWTDTAMEFSSMRVVRQGEPLPAQLESAAWGAPAANGLRAAWLLEPAPSVAWASIAEFSYRLGTVLKARVLFHNTGKAPVVFETETWHQDDQHSARDAKGAEIPVKATWFTGITPTSKFRLAPGEYCEVSGHGIAIGAGEYPDEHSTGAVGAIIEAKEGETVTLSHSVDAGTGGWTRPDDLWLATIAGRVANEAPMPASTADREQLIRRVTLDIFGVAPTAEEIAAFTVDNTPDALAKLTARLQTQPRIEPFAGKLPTGETKFRVIASDPNAAKAPRTATAPGRYVLSDVVHLQITQTNVNPYRAGSVPFLQNKATIIFLASDPSDPRPYEIAPPKPCEIELPAGEGAYAFAWVRDSGELWLLRKAENFLWRYRFAADGLKEEGRYDLWPPTLLSQPLRRALQDAMGLRAATDIPPLGDEALEQPEPGPGPQKSAKLKPGTEERLSWGAPVNGLRAALVRMSPETELAPGAVVDLNVVVQNVSDAPVKLRGGSPLANVNLKAVRRDGTEAELVPSIVDVLSTIDEFTLQPREVAVMSLMSVGIGKHDANAKSAHGRSIGYWLPDERAVTGFKSQLTFTSESSSSWSGSLAAETPKSAAQPKAGPKLDRATLEGAWEREKDGVTVKLEFQWLSEHQQVRWEVKRPSSYIAAEMSVVVAPDGNSAEFIFRKGLEFEATQGRVTPGEAGTLNLEIIPNPNVSDPGYPAVKGLVLKPRSTA